MDNHINQPARKKTTKPWLVVSVIAGLAIVLLLSAAMILTVRKQQQNKQASLAPNAPESKPQASSNNESYCPATDVYRIAAPPQNFTGFKPVANGKKTANCQAGEVGEITALITGHRLVKVGSDYKYQVLIEVTRSNSQIERVQIDSHSFYCPTPADFDDYNNDPNSPPPRVCNLQPGQNINDVLDRVNVVFNGKDTVKVIAESPLVKADQANQCGGWQTDARIHRYQIRGDQRMLDCSNLDDPDYIKNSFTGANCNQFGVYPEDDCGLPANWCAATPTATPTAIPTTTPSTTPSVTVSPSPSTLPSPSEGTPTDTPTSAPTDIAPTATLAPGCNEVCKTNADCAISNPNYICYQTDDGSSRCRLDSNPKSVNCAPAATAQPTLPNTLPEAGVADWMTWFTAGFAILGVGVVLLLLL